MKYKECLAKPNADDKNPCIESNYNCYQCKYWIYEEIEGYTEPNIGYKIVSFIAVLAAFLLFIAFMNL
jgi:hypothetical protein